jgi:hypothetical protein
MKRTSKVRLLPSFKNNNSSRCYTVLFVISDFYTFLQVYKKYLTKG